MDWPSRSHSQRTGELFQRDPQYLCLQRQSDTTGKLHHASRAIQPARREGPARRALGSTSDPKTRIAPTQSVGPSRVVGLTKTPADLSCDRQPLLATGFRNRTGQDQRRLRNPRRIAFASGAFGLACDRIRRIGLGCQILHAIDAHLSDF